LVLMSALDPGTRFGHRAAFRNLRYIGPVSQRANPCCNHGVRGRQPVIPWNRRCSFRRAPLMSSFKCSTNERSHNVRCPLRSLTSSWTIPQRLQDRNRQHLKQRSGTMHQFVCSCRLAHIVQLKRISCLGFQCSGVNHARSTRALEASSGWLGREAFPTKLT